MQARCTVTVSSGKASQMATVESLQRLNNATRNGAIRLLEPLVERAPWVAEQTVDYRPFRSDQDVAQHLVDTILEAGFEKRIALFHGHPELAGREAIAGTMTDASTSEQARLGLVSLAPDAAARLSQLNAAYSNRFGYPFILALHRIPDLETLFEIFERRMAASRVEEHVSTLAEIASVIGARATRAFGSPSQHADQLRSAEAADG